MMTENQIQEKENLEKDQSENKLMFESGLSIENKRNKLRKTHEELNDGGTKQVNCF